jgi:hypothetical protein
MNFGCDYLAPDEKIIVSQKELNNASFGCE